MTANQRKLSKNEEAVLRAMFKARDEGELSIDEIAIAATLSVSDASEALSSLKKKGFVGGGSPSLLDEATAIVNAVEPSLSPTSPDFGELVVLAASSLVSTSDSDLARQLGFDPGFVSIIGARLRASGVWAAEGGLSDRHREAWEKDDLSFLLDAQIALGNLIIVGHGDDGPQYKMTEGGLRDAARLIKRAGGA